MGESSIGAGTPAPRPAATPQQVPRRPAWVDDEEALREAAAEAYSRLLEDGEFIDAANYYNRLGGTE
jgi:hypothetical protein